MSKKGIMAEKQTEQKQFVLVHGICHGGWCWYKLKPLLESAGHRVTALDLAASGTNTLKIEDVHTFSDYSNPLLDFLASLAPKEKVVLVGHSFGGMSIALAMDKFPHKISLAVFLTAFAPDTHHKPSYVLEEYIKRYPITRWLDSDSDPEISNSGNKVTLQLGIKLLSTKFYQLCSTEDLELVKTLMRKGSLFTKDLSKVKNFSTKGYGCVPCAYIVSNEDLAIPKEYQEWIIQNAGIDVVREINGADHMIMLSKPQELCLSLLEITEKHAYHDLSNLYQQS